MCGGFIHLTPIPSEGCAEQTLCSTHPGRRKPVVTVSVTTGVLPGQYPCADRTESVSTVGTTPLALVQDIVNTMAITAIPAAMFEAT